MKRNKLLIAKDHSNLLGETVVKFVEKNDTAGSIEIIEINPKHMNGEAFCENYGFPPEASLNCVIVRIKPKSDSKRDPFFCACVGLIGKKLDVNKVVVRHFDARKASFAPLEEVLLLTKMEYGSITPIGLPHEWPILIDKKVLAQEKVAMGSGLQKSKIVVPTDFFKKIDNITFLDNLSI